MSIFILFHLYFFRKLSFFLENDISVNLKKLVKHRKFSNWILLKNNSLQLTFPACCLCTVFCMKEGFRVANTHRINTDLNVALTCCFLNWWYTIFQHTLLKIITVLKLNWFFFLNGLINEGASEVFCLSVTLPLLTGHAINALMKMLNAPFSI